jgi:hypothetical protein
LTAAEIAIGQSSTSMGADMDGAPTEDTTLVEGLADLAHSASHTASPERFARLLAIRARAPLGAAAVGVLLASEDGVLTAVGSPDRPELTALYRRLAGPGPAVRCWRSGRPCAATYLSVLRQGSLDLAEAMLGAGVGFLDGLPLMAGTTSVGAIVALRAEPAPRTPWDECVRNTVRRLANLAATTLVIKGALCSASERAEQLELALASRIVIEQAKGYLAARLDIGVDEAFLRLRAFCRDRNLPLWRIARELVDGSLAVSEQLRLITGR